MAPARDTNSSSERVRLAITWASTSRWIRVWLSKISSILLSVVRSDGSSRATTAVPSGVSHEGAVLANTATLLLLHGAAEPPSCTLPAVAGLALALEEASSAGGGVVSVHLPAPVRAPSLLPGVAMVRENRSGV